jgi:N-acetylglucosamine transport system substrate-binding protein
MMRESRHWAALLMLGVAVIGCDAVRPVAGIADEASVTLEAAVFEGGYGIRWHTQMAKRYSDQQPQVEVQLWGDPRIAEKLKPRLLRGDPPDVVVEQRLPMWLLITNNKLMPFNAVLEQPAFGMEDRWQDLFIPGTLTRFSSDGKIWAVPMALGAWACWYDARLFRRHGWEVPATWDAFEQLCDKIQGTGIAPLAFQGKYPIYSWWTYISLVQRCGGLAGLNRINALEPGAFSHPDAVQAAALVQRMAQRYFQPGAMAMTHTDSQLQFINNQAAMIFCGVWLENEMKASTPPGFEMRCFNVPAVSGGKGNPRMFNGSGGEYVFIPADGRYPEQAFEFARYMISPVNAPEMGRSIGVISPLRGATPREALSPALQSVLDMMEGDPGIFSDRLDTLLLEWTNQVMVPSLAKLLRGALTPEAFGAALDAGIAAAKANPDIYIPDYAPYDPSAFGEPS